MSRSSIRVVNCGHAFIRSSAAAKSYSSHQYAARSCTNASGIPCDQSSTVSRSGHRVLRRRRAEVVDRSRIERHSERDELGVGHADPPRRLARGRYSDVRPATAALDALERPAVSTTSSRTDRTARRATCEGNDMMESVDGGALAGWRVLEIADGVAASFCAKVLGDLGADVVKVEPPGGHPSRRWGPRRPDAAPHEPGGRFLYLNTGKASVVVPDGPEGAERLACARVGVRRRRHRPPRADLARRARRGRRPWS